MAVGSAYLFPPLWSSGASIAVPLLHFHAPHIEPNMQISGIRLAGKTSRFNHPDISAFPEKVVGPAGTSFISRLARHSLELRSAHSRFRQFATRYTEGLSHFVTSMTAPVTSGWSDGRVKLAPTGKSPPRPGAHPKPILALPKEMERRLLTTLRKNVMKIGAKIVTLGHTRWRLHRSAPVHRPAQTDRGSSDQENGARPFTL